MNSKQSAKRKHVPAELAEAWRVLGTPKAIDELNQAWPTFSPEERRLTMTLTILELLTRIVERQAATK